MEENCPYKLFLERRLQAWMSQSSSKIEAFRAASVLKGVRCFLDFQQASQLDDVGLASASKLKLH